MSLSSHKVRRYLGNADTLRLLCEVIALHIPRTRTVVLRVLRDVLSLVSPATFKEWNLAVVIHGDEVLPHLSDEKGSSSYVSLLPSVAADGGLLLFFLLQAGHSLLGTELDVFSRGGRKGGIDRDARRISPPISLFPSKAEEGGRKGSEAVATAVPPSRMGVLREEGTVKSSTESKQEIDAIFADECTFRFVCVCPCIYFMCYVLNFLSDVL